MKKQVVKSVTELSSNYERLEEMTLKKILEGINTEDQSLPNIVRQALPSIEVMASAVITTLQREGRLFYVGAGTSGRLGVLDASEIFPTYGLSNKIIGIIAGGEKALRKAVEHAEDNMSQAWKDLTDYSIISRDMVIGISASGNTPYVAGGLEEARRQGITTGCIVGNQNSALARHADFSVELITGPEFVTGSTRMKAGTAQKLVLNMISTSAMIALGRVYGNTMVDMQPTNHKLVHRSEMLLMKYLDIDRAKAGELLKQYGTVRKAMNAFNS